MTLVLDQVHHALHVGIDVSKAELHVHVHETAAHFVVANTAPGWAQLVRRLGPAAKVRRIAIEPSGGYEKDVVRQLRQKAYDVVVVNPRRARQFAEAVRGLAKSDPIDAADLAHYGDALRLPQPVPRDALAERLAEYLTFRNSLVERAKALKCQLQQLRDHALRRLAEQELDHIKAHLAILNRDMQAMAKADADTADQLQRWQSAPGVGRLSAIALRALLPELGHLDSRTIAALVGVAPFRRDSGQQRRHRSPTGGRALLRQILYMAVTAAIRADNAIAAFYRRLCQRGKPHKLALVAAINKLLHCLNAMERDRANWRSPS